MKKVHEKEKNIKGNSLLKEKGERGKRQNMLIIKSFKLIFLYWFFVLVSKKKKKIASVALLLSPKPLPFFHLKEYSPPL